MDPFAPASADKVEAWLENAMSPPAPETHCFSLASEDPEDLTIKQARLLGEADTVCAQPGIPAAILARARADAARLVCDSKSCGTDICPKAESTGLTVILRSAKSATQQS